MSKFLAFDAYSVSLGSSMEDIKISMLAGLTNRGYQVVADGISYESVTATGGISAENAAKIFHNSNENITAYASIGASITLKCATPQEITKYRIISSYYLPERTWVGWTLAYSDDGVAFTTCDTRTGENLYTYENREYVLASAPGAHRYWRWTNTGIKAGTYSEIPRIVPYTSSGKHITKNPALVLAPPANEPIGNDIQREVVAFVMMSNQLQIRLGTQYLKDTPPVVGIHSAAAGAVVTSVSFGTETVAIPTPPAAATANDNLWALFRALKNSTLPEFSQWEWIYQQAPAQNASDTKDWVLGYRRSYAPVFSANNQSFTATNTTFVQVGMPVKAGTTPCWVAVENWALAGTLTTDLVSGFIYYMQINSRGFAIATKTNVGFYGPIHACWGDHAKAIAAMPASPIPFLTTPIELLGGMDDPASGNAATACCATFWAMGTGDVNTTALKTGDPNAGNGHPMSRSVIRSVFTNYHGQSTYGARDNNASFTLAISGLTNSTTLQNVVDDFQVHSMRVPGISAVNLYLSPSQYGFLPMIDIDDWYRFRGTASNESLMLAADQVAGATLSVGHAIADAPTYLQLDTVESFVPAGLVAVGSEVYAYTGKDVGQNRLTGVTRARHGTVARDHWAGEMVYQALWFTVINGGALFCGYTKPS